MFRRLGMLRRRMVRVMDWRDGTDGGVSVLVVLVVTTLYMHLIGRRSHLVELCIARSSEECCSISGGEGKQESRIPKRRGKPLR